MKWISQVIVDLIVLITTIAYLFISSEVLYYILWGYTALMLLSRILYYFVDFLRLKAKNTDVPLWFYHLNYALISIALASSASYYLMTAWILIWILSSLPKK